VASLVVRLVGPDLSPGSLKDSDWAGEDSVDREIDDFG
jgi:hypothetical protein